MFHRHLGCLRYKKSTECWPTFRQNLYASIRWSRTASDYAPLRSNSFTVGKSDATKAFTAYHRSPLTKTPRVDSVEQKYAAFYLFNATAKTEFRASIGRSMSVPYRDPQTGKVFQRQRIVWTTLPQIHEINSDYSHEDPQSQVYAGMEQYEELMRHYLPLHVSSMKTHQRSNIPEESFQMTTEYAQTKLKGRIIEHASQIAREMLMQEYGANVKINEISVNISLKATYKVFYPLWIFTTTTTTAGRSLKTLVSGVTGKAVGLKMYDPILSGAVASVAAGVSITFLLGSPILAFLLAGMLYLGVSTAIKWLPIWRTMRWEGRRAADVLANQQQTGQSRGFAGFGNFNPFDAFTRGRDSGQSRQDPFSQFDPFATGGGFNGQRRSSDPFYGYGGRSSGSSQSRGGSGQAQAQRSSEDLYSVLGVKKTATQDEITKAFRNLALHKHPDKVSAEKKAAASKEFAKINEAYRVLRSPGKRDQYDKYGVV